MGVVFQTTPFVFEFIKSLSISSPKKEKFCWLKRDAKRNLTSSSFYSRVCVCAVCCRAVHPFRGGSFLSLRNKSVCMTTHTRSRVAGFLDPFLFWNFVKNVLLVNRLPLDLVWQIPIIDNPKSARQDQHWQWFHSHTTYDRTGSVQHSDSAKHNVRIDLLPIFLSLSLFDSNDKHLLIIF